jgi:hypothetical protein
MGMITQRLLDYYQQRTYVTGNKHNFIFLKLPQKAPQGHAQLLSVRQGRRRRLREQAGAMQRWRTRYVRRHWWWPRCDSARHSSHWRCAAAAAAAAAAPTSAIFTRILISNRHISTSVGVRASVCARVRACVRACVCRCVIRVIRVRLCVRAYVRAYVYSVRTVPCTRVLEYIF